MPTIEIAIIGGGASGMAAAIAASKVFAETGRRRNLHAVTLFERNGRQGEKIRISGGGKCNLTHDGPVDLLLEKGFLEPAERRFLRHAVHGFTNRRIMEMMEAEGVKLLSRPDGKVFTRQGNADSVAETLASLVRRAGVRTVYEARVTGVRFHEGLFELETGDTLSYARRLIISAGGTSWPQLGTTGDGMRLAVSLGHAKSAAAPALAPLYLKDPPGSALSGVALRGVSLYAASGRLKAVRRGDVLFTHRGLSGPAALSLSREAARIMAESGACTLSADLFPFHEPGALDEELLRHAARHGSQMVRKFLQGCPIAPQKGIGGGECPNGTIPTALVEHLLHQGGIGADTIWGGLQKKRRQALVAVLKRLPLGELERVPMEQGEVSAGGVVLSEVNPRTMESRRVPGLYLTGEVLDYAGEIGGFNLQAAFSTGWLAGMSAAQSEQE
ncbi:aminoacetone oxidase family FAD-binding enzyme [Chlorobium sp. N1]|uniref:NAD(P)/FAD-dependent oxidoreductase n=1 Tax=Chlorobium sp. N1 TaxID=2491138 RepID=UPI00103F768F|nr:aminoacetone oxidase family FAD-binding enzyme [Chlorobium sp. N1]TCD47445.1 aminoacetone oxidase family FAD-binding enzyme [Chlorobium sp. N1]